MASDALAFWFAGQSAFHAGKKFRENPYDPDGTRGNTSIAAGQWSDGWSHAYNEVLRSKRRTARKREEANPDAERQ